MSAAEFAPLINAGSLLLGVAVAVFTAVRVTARHNEAQRHEWNEDRRRRVSESFRQLHELLWRDEGVVRIRRAIVNDVEYERGLLPVLKKRNASERNVLDREENNIIEDLDRYCGTVLRMETAMRQLPFTEEEERLWRKLLWRSWKERIAANRPDMYRYIELHWGEELLGLPGESPRIAGALATAAPAVGAKSPG